MSSKRNIKEFIAMIALLTSIGALAIDAILPAFAPLSDELSIPLQQRFWIISILILGMALGQILYGPLSDYYGRRPPLLWGMLVFLGGTLLCLFAPNFELLLLGRLLQGVGAAAPRVVTGAIVRDSYEGREMAQILSFSMSVFILVPIVAPSLGQFILMVAHWRWIFGFILIVAVVALVWFLMMQEETLAPEDRLPLSFKQLYLGSREVFSNRQAFGFTLASGVVFGGFLGYLNSSQYIFQEIYQQGELFGVYFAVLAVAFGSAFIVNGQLVMKFGMIRISFWASISLACFSSLFLFTLMMHSYLTPLWLTMAFFIPIFFSIALIFGNMQALAMVPMGHIAGMASSIIGSFSTLMAVPVGSWIGSNLHGDLMGIGYGFVFSGVVGLACILWASSKAVEQQ